MWSQDTEQCSSKGGKRDTSRKIIFELYRYEKRSCTNPGLNFEQISATSKVVLLDLTHQSGEPKLQGTCSWISESNIVPSFNDEASTSKKTEDRHVFQIGLPRR